MLAIILTTISSIDPAIYEPLKHPPVIPEPSTWIMFISGIYGIISATWLKKGRR